MSCYLEDKARYEWISFKDGETVDLYGIQRVVEIAHWFARWYYDQGYQVVFAIHTDTEHLYIHYVINSVNFITGKRESAVELSEYIDCFDGLIDEKM